MALSYLEAYTRPVYINNVMPLASINYPDGPFTAEIVIRNGERAIRVMSSNTNDVINAQDFFDSPVGWVILPHEELKLVVNNNFYLIAIRHQAEGPGLADFPVSVNVRVLFNSL